MISPFPGMDPYLEQRWQDVHARLILYACDQLEEQLPGNLVARVEERLVFEMPDLDGHSAYPDVKIVEHPIKASSRASTVSGSALMEPVIVRYRSEPATETFINILDRVENLRLVTVIEILSPANKLPGEGQRLYRRKQQELCSDQVSLVEIDLLRRGERVFSLPATRIPPLLGSTYQVCVRRGWKPEASQLYLLPLRGPLPSIRIPLRRQDNDVRLDLQLVLNQAYRKGRYGATIDYRQPPDPPLSREDDKWAKALIRKAKA